MASFGQNYDEFRREIMTGDGQNETNDDAMIKPIETVLQFEFGVLLGLSSLSRPVPRLVSHLVSARLGPRPVMTPRATK
jgi:hypothetical protein